MKFEIQQDDVRAIAEQLREIPYKYVAHVLVMFEKALKTVPESPAVEVPKGNAPDAT
jgi:hypothetical protein